MFRSLRRRAGPTRVFEARLSIAQLDSIPVTSAVMFVRWEVLRASLATPPTGRTLSKPVEQGNVVRWNEAFEFSVRIPSDPRDASLLQPCVLRLSIRSERRRKTGDDQHGVVEVDLAEVAGVGRVARSFLVHESILNSLLKVNLKMVLSEGDSIFRRPIGAMQPSSTAQSVPAPSSSIATGLAALNSASSASLGSSVLPSSENLQVFVNKPSVANSLGGSGTSAGLSSGNGSGRFNSSKSRLVPPSSFAPSAIAGEALSAVHNAPSQSQRSTSSPLPSTSQASKVAAVPQLPSISLPTINAPQIQRPYGAWPSPGLLPHGPLHAPMSPRSPIATSAAAVLESLVPETAQEEVYETIRLARVRDFVPPYILASRVPAGVAIDRLLAKERMNMYAAPAPEPSRMFSCKDERI
jgi:N-terminal C2 in EEIG1 and EHBP1 proteins